MSNYTKVPENLDNSYMFNGSTRIQTLKHKQNAAIATVKNSDRLTRKIAAKKADRKHPIRLLCERYLELKERTTASEDPELNVFIVNFKGIYHQDIGFLERYTHKLNLRIYKKIGNQLKTHPFLRTVTVGGDNYLTLKFDNGADYQAVISISLDNGAKSIITCKKRNLQSLEFRETIKDLEIVIENMLTDDL